MPGSKRTIYLEWQKPRKLIDRQWEQEGLPALKSIVRTCVIASLLLVIPTLAAIAYFIPELLAHTVLVTCGGLIAFPGWMFVLIWCSSKDPVKYQIQSRGLFDGTTLYAWKQIESYSITSHDYLPDLRVLELNVKPYKFPHRWCFDPEQLDERHLCDLISQHGVATYRTDRENVTT